MTFRPDIQGLRAIAVALVVAAHAGLAALEGGFVGVDVFFVLSGYLITGLLLEERLATGTIGYGRFLARRLRRLLPAMLTMLLFVLVVSSIVLTAFEMRMQARSFPYAVAWISNFFFAFAERDYFQALQDDDLFLHTWSLGVEEQFYLVWPWLILLLAGLKSADKRRISIYRTTAVALSIIAMASFAISILLTAHAEILAFYMMPARFWQFALGAIVYTALHMATSEDGRGDKAGSAVASTLAGLVGAVLVLGSAAMIRADISYPGWYALAPSVGAALLIAAGTLDRRNTVSGLLQRRPMVWIGDRSYSIYLWHWPFFVVGGALGIARTPAGVVLLIALTVACAAASYRWVEYPLWKGRFRNASPRPVVIAATFAIALSLGAFSALQHRVFGSLPNAAVRADYDPRSDLDSRIYGSTKDCDTAHNAAEIVPCAIGDPGATKLAILLGDSVGAQWSPLVEGLLPREDWQILVLTKSACAIVDKTWYYGKVGGNYVICTEWRNAALEFIEQEAPDVLFIGSSAYYRFERSDWIDGTRGVLDRAAAAAGQVVILPGIPRLSFDGPSCLEDPWRFSFRLIDGDRECEEARTELMPDAVAGYLREAARTYDNAHVLGLDDLVCPERRCAASTRDGIAVYRDKTHVTASFARSLIPDARRRLNHAGVSVSPAIPVSGSRLR